MIAAPDMSPLAERYLDVCLHGLSRVRPLRVERARRVDRDGWNFSPGRPPSLSGFGRLRALLTLERARSLQPARVLEVAAGDGALSAALAALGAEAWVNDLRSEHLDDALECFENEGQLNRAPGDLFALEPERLGRFDLVAACEILEHVAHPERLLAHLARFLSPGGALLVTTPNGRHLRNRLPTLGEVSRRSELEARQFQPDADGHLFLITPAELVQIASEAGLVVERLELFGSPAITGHLGLRHVARVLPISWCLALEQVATRGFLRERLGFGILAVLKRAPACEDLTSGRARRQGSCS